MFGRQSEPKSPEELVRFMLADPQLGIKYLYSGRVG